MKFVQLVFIALFTLCSFNAQADNFVSENSYAQDHHFTRHDSPKGDEWLFAELLEESERGEEFLGHYLVSQFVLEPKNIVSKGLFSTNNLLVTRRIVSELHLRGPPLQMSLS